MPTDPNIRDHAYQFFLEEAPELLQTIEAGLLALGQRRDIADIHQMMRAAHSIKGGAASVGLEPIKAIAHRLETLFKALYSEDVILDSALETELLRAYDCLRLPLTEQLAQGIFDGDLALALAEPVLQGLETQLAPAIAATENFIPSSSDLGVDMATAIFEVDVQQGLDHLAQVLEQPAAYEVAGELRAQAEIFMGFAELLDLPGFALIAQTTLAALAANPALAVDITRLAVEDFRQGREAFLTQGSTTGGEPSAALQTLTQPGSGPGLANPLVADLAAAVEVTAVAVTDAAEDPEVLPLLFPDEIDEAWPDGFGDALLGEAEALEWLAQTQDAIDAHLDWLPDLEPLAAPIVTEPVSSPSPPVAGPSLATLFTDLSPATNSQSTGSTLPHTTPISPPPLSPSPSPPFPPSSPPPLPPGLTVRVNTQRLAQLDNQLGELTINRNGLALQTSQIRLGLRELISRFEQVRATVEQLRGVSDQILVAPERQPPPVLASEMPLPSALALRPPGFDALEMDTYSTLYTQTQTLLEDMVQLEEAVADITLFNQQSEQLLEQHRKMLSQMQDELMYARRVPLGQVLNRLPRVLRDLSNTYDKPAELTLIGTDLMVDKAVLEKLYDPLLHLLRNGFDHGLEPPEERRQQGKSEVGQITMRAYYRGRQVILEVEDDGRGLDLDRVRQRAIDLGWVSAAEASAMGAEPLSRYIFEPGFSTAEQVSELSGRGVGLDVVREQMRSLKGTLTVQSVAGQGTRFSLALPMTLSIVNLLVCFVGSTPIAFRSDSITEILVPHADQLKEHSAQRWLTWRDRTVPVYRLSDLLTYRCLRPEISLSRVLAAVPSPSDWEAPLLVLAQGEEAFAIQVDRLVTEQESVIKPFGPALSPPPYAYGCTVLGDGSLIPVIDGQAFWDDLLARSLAARPTATVAEAVSAIADQGRDSVTAPAAPLHRATTILVVDDAITSRRTLALSLERVGYRVLQARDGQEALEQLQQNPAVGLVVCDIEMPNMNGFEFLTQRRQDPALAAIPTLMLTSRSNDKHRWLALQLGATGYFSKPYLEQEFLGAIATHLQTAAPQPT
ncbi:MAG: response regulator [Nodosilinea sp.]